MDYCNARESIICNHTLMAYEPKVQLRLSHIFVCPQMHGTGTPLGDPIEIGAIAGVYLGAGEAQCITLASTKSQLGHAEPAAGEPRAICIVGSRNRKDGSIH